jgi:hypothetical protein
MGRSDAKTSAKLVTSPVDPADDDGRPMSDAINLCTLHSFVYCIIFLGWGIFLVITIFKIYNIMNTNVTFYTMGEFVRECRANALAKL